MFAPSVDRVAFDHAIDHVGGIGFGVDGAGRNSETAAGSSRVSLRQFVPSHGNFGVAT
jgi:hypothetical protein